MKTFAAATLLTLAAVANAQLPDIPDCATNCLVTPLTSDGCDDLVDFACHCKKADTLFAAVTPCVKENCTPEEESSVISMVQELCAQNGVTVELPSASATPTPTASASEEPATTTSTSTVVESSTDSMVPTMPSMMPTPTGNGTGNGTLPTGVPSPSDFPGAAAHATQAVGLLGAAALAMLAL